MSRSNPSLTNPAQYFFRWAGSLGQLSYWDKAKEQNVVVKLPFVFMVLDELATITGYSKPAKSFYWSNEVRNTKKEELTVKTQAGTVYQGMYKNDQGIVQMPKGAEYAQSIYLACKMNGEWVIGNLKASGSARSAWFDYSNNHKPQNGTTVMTKGDVQAAQTGDFYPPVFEYKSSTTEENDIAMELDRQLQVYLNTYLSAQKIVEDHEDTDEVSGYEKFKASRPQPKDDEADFASAMAKGLEADGIDLNDIPFR